ncbi:hypothetical protein D3C75_958350 [compost metagenome]
MDVLRRREALHFAGCAAGSNNGNFTLKFHELLQHQLRHSRFAVLRFSTRRDLPEGCFQR